jgi:4-hydroxybutyryl-CoA dehydratase/vinylacetyl-CoA-Delta-isomerase
VVDRTSDGVVIRGAGHYRRVIGHELMTIPTKAMKTGDDDYAIAAMTPVNAPGVKIANTPYAPRHSDLRDFPVSGHDHYPEGFVIFDDVVVPNERILGGEVRPRRGFAHSLGLREPRWPLRQWPTAQTSGRLGLADRRSERPGRRRPHTEKVSEMVSRHRGASCLEAALSHAKAGVSGASSPTSSTPMPPSTPTPPAPTSRSDTCSTSPAAPL